MPESNSSASSLNAAIGLETEGRIDVPEVKFHQRHVSLDMLMGLAALEHSGLSMGLEPDNLLVLEDEHMWRENLSVDAVNGQLGILKFITETYQRDRDLIPDLVAVPTSIVHAQDAALKAIHERAVTAIKEIEETWRQRFADYFNSRSSELKVLAETNRPLPACDDVYEAQAAALDKYIADIASAFESLSQSVQSVNPEAASKLQALGQAHTELCQIFCQGWHDLISIRTRTKQSSSL